jgi:hypothetical protein
MGDEVRVHIALPVDDRGMIGRQCPSCDQYFKLKPGTGLQDITTTACPYCEYRSDSSDFTTDDQIEYAKSVAVNQVLGPPLRELQRSLKRLERKSRGSLIQFKAIGTDIRFPMRYYKEKDLETIVECDNCGLFFAVYGVFASCPDCLRLNPMSMFKNSLEAVRKRLAVIENIPDTEVELRQGLIADSISAGVSAFDGLGKKLRMQRPDVFPPRPRNLFQNLRALEEALGNCLGFDLKKSTGESGYQQLNYMFQVRHIWIHNFGEADRDFVENTSSDESVLGAKVVPSRQEVSDFLDVLEGLGLEIRTALGDSG